MKRLAVIAFLMMGCSVPAFETELCVDSCSQCGILTCDSLCGLLEDGYASDNCAEETDRVWTCALPAECDFPDVCEEQIRQFLICE